MSPLAGKELIVMHRHIHLDEECINSVSFVTNKL